MTTAMDPLYAMLHRWAATPHEWSYCDCFTVLGDWVQVVHGTDPAAEIRGTYGDPAVCPVGRAYRADPIPLGERLLAAYPVVDTAAFGDVAFVRLGNERFLCGAIKLKGRSWALKTEARGVLVLRHGVVPQRIWGIGYAS